MLDDVTADRLTRVHEEALRELRQMPGDALVVCHICGGRAPEPEFCGCGGFQEVEEAIRYHELEIEILSK